MFALLRTEFFKQTRRLRTLVVFLVVIGIPVLIALAINSRNRPDRGERRGPGLFRLAKTTGLVLPATTLEVMSGFLLVVVVAMFAGDSISGDANSGNLRYLLMRPVNRTKLLLSKMTISFVLTWAVTIAVTVSSLAIGVALFGWHPLNVPLVVTLSTGTLVKDLVLATAYVAFGFTALIGASTFFSTLTDSPAGAIGAGVGFYIVSAIMDSVDSLGVMRYGFPTHYVDSWQTLFLEGKTSHDLIAGIVVQLAWFAIFTVAAVVYFDRKDIKS